VHLDGIHHITAITADARRNVDFYVRVLGLRLVKKTVNFDAPDFYHLYYGSELGAPGSLITFFELPDSPPGTAGAGMVHRVIWRVGSPDALEFWAGRLGSEGIATEQEPSALIFSDPEGLGLELVVDETHDQPLTVSAPEIPARHALLGLEGVRVYTKDQNASHYLLTGALRFTPLADNVGYRLRGGAREALYHYDPAPAEEGFQGAGSVHHVAWASRDEDHLAWRSRVIEEGIEPTDVIDRVYFRSIYFREPSGVLFEIATLSPGFTVDEPPERLGESLMLPEQHEPLRHRLEQKLTPIVNPHTPSGARR
jgi:glyoxalase family protein